MAKHIYPAGVLGIWDNGGKTINRYTVFYRRQGGSYPYLDMSEHPGSGVCHHGTTPVKPGAWMGGRRKIAFEDLPNECQETVMSDLKEAS